MVRTEGKCLGVEAGVAESGQSFHLHLLWMTPARLFTHRLAAYLKLCPDPENQQNEESHLGRVQALKFKEKCRSLHCLFDTYELGYTQP